jgi:hypothetical protein
MLIFLSAALSISLLVAGEAGAFSKPPHQHNSKVVAATKVQTQASMRKAAPEVDAGSAAQALALLSGLLLLIVERSRNPLA